MTLPRAVIFNPQGRDNARCIDLCARFAVERGYTVVCVVRRIEDAIYELGHGRGDVLIVLHAGQLHPMIEIVTDLVDVAGRASNPKPPRRTRRLK